MSFVCKDVYISATLNDTGLAPSVLNRSTVTLPTGTRILKPCRSSAALIGLLAEPIWFMPLGHEPRSTGMPLLNASDRR